MNKIVNGKLIKCSDKDRRFIESEWESNKTKRQLRRDEFQRKQEFKTSCLKKLQEKLGFTREEINSIF